MSVVETAKFWFEQGWYTVDELKQFIEHNDRMNEHLRSMVDGVALTNVIHPVGDPVSDDLELNPESLENIEIDIPMNIKELAEQAGFDDLDIHDHGKRLEHFAELIRADEREKFADKYLEANYKYASLLQAVTDPENQPSQFGTVTDEYMEQAVLKEREQCAKVCEKHAQEAWDQEGGALNCADKIRARGEK